MTNRRTESLESWFKIRLETPQDAGFDTSQNCIFRGKKMLKFPSITAGGLSSYSVEGGHAVTRNEREGKLRPANVKTL